MVDYPPGFSRSPHQEHNIPALKLGNSVIELKNRLELKTVKVIVDLILHSFSVTRA